MQSYMSVPYCMAVPNTSGMNSILPSYPLCLFEEVELCVQYSLFYNLVVFLLDSQVWQQMSTNTSYPQGKVPLIFFVSGLVMLCLYVGSYHPSPQWSRETDNVFQPLKLNQTV